MNATLDRAALALVRPTDATDATPTATGDEDLVAFVRAHRAGNALADGCACGICQGFRAELTRHAATRAQAQAAADRAEGLRLDLDRLAPTGDLWRVQGMSATSYQEAIVHAAALDATRDRLLDAFTAEGASVLAVHLRARGELHVERHRFEGGRWHAGTLLHWTGRPRR